MKKAVFSALSLTLMLIIVTGCSGNNPKSVTVQFMEALMNNDIKKADSLVDGDAFSKMESYATWVFDAEDKSENKAYLKEFKKKVVCEINENGEEAECSAENMIGFDLIKVNGKWKLDFGLGDQK